MRTVKVEITRDDGSFLRVVGEEAERWQKAVEGQATLSMVHGVNFPELKWEEGRSLDALYTELLAAASMRDHCMYGPVTEHDRTACLGCRLNKAVAALKNESGV